MKTTEAIKLQIKRLKKQKKELSTKTITPYNNGWLDALDYEIEYLSKLIK